MPNDQSRLYMQNNPALIRDGGRKNCLHHGAGVLPGRCFLWLSLLLLPAFQAIPPAGAAIVTLTQTQCRAMHRAGVISEAMPVPCARLRTVTFRYINFAGNSDHGRIVVLDAVAGHVQKIFNELYRIKFPLQHARPAEYYNGDDRASMQDNNTSAFNGRAITGGNVLSQHASGLAIDVNPQQNPYLATGKDNVVQVLPPQAAAAGYLNRMQYRAGKPLRPGMVTTQIVDIFARHGFLIWGGYWDNPVDYQHFQAGPRWLAEKLTTLPARKAGEAFLSYVQAWHQCMQRTHARTHEEARAHCVTQVTNPAAGSGPVVSS